MAETPEASDYTAIQKRTLEQDSEIAGRKPKPIQKLPEDLQTASGKLLPFADQAPEDPERVFPYASSQRSYSMGVRVVRDRVSDRAKRVRCWPGRAAIEQMGSKAGWDAHPNIKNGMARGCCQPVRRNRDGRKNRQRHVVLIDTAGLMGAPSFLTPHSPRAFLTSSSSPSISSTRKSRNFGFSRVRCCTSPGRNRPISLAKAAP